MLNSSTHKNRYKIWSRLTRRFLGFGFGYSPEEGERNWRQCSCRASGYKRGDLIIQDVGDAYLPVTW